MVGRRTIRAVWLAAAAAGLGLLLGGCPNLINTPSDKGGPAKLVKFQSADELVQYFNAQVQAQRRQATGGWSFGLPLLASAPPNAMEDQAGGTGGTGGRDDGDGTPYSGTNLQEEGVDEADVFKSDGTYFYLIEGQTLRIVRANPLAEVAQLDLGHWLNDLYLLGDTVIAVGLPAVQSGGASGAPQPAVDVAWMPYTPNTRTWVGQIDVSDRAAPALVHEVELDGARASSRGAAGRLVRVTTFAPGLPPGIGLAAPEVTLEGVTPKWRADGAEQTLVDWDGWYRPNNPDGYQTTAVVTIDTADVRNVIGSLAVVAAAGTIYMSPEALYLTDTQYDLNGGSRPVTAIHKITFDAAGVPQYAASGSVPGRLLNQFSLSEHEGHLRVASHVENFQFWAEPVWSTAVLRGDAAVAAAEASPPPARPYNGVYVLGQDGEALEIVGQIEDIAPGEQIYAARFLGPRGFLVTFERIDPLFAFDLSDPAAPQLMGELKVPGFSDYLHPVGPNHLIGVGQAIEEDGPWGQQNMGIQVSLFDVPDWTSPQVVEQLTVGGPGSYADASQTHKAFTYMPESGLLALPATVTGGAAGSGEYSYRQAVLCYRVDTATGFEPVGTLNCVGSAAYYWYSSSWRRAAFVGETLYAATDEGVRAAPVADLTQTTEVVFERDQPPAWGWYDGGWGGATEPSPGWR